MIRFNQLLKVQLITPEESLEIFNKKLLENERENLKTLMNQELLV